MFVGLNLSALKIQVSDYLMKPMGHQLSTSPCLIFIEVELV